MNKHLRKLQLCKNLLTVQKRKLFQFYYVRKIDQKRKYFPIIIKVSKIKDQLEKNDGFIRGNHILMFILKDCDSYFFDMRYCKYIIIYLLRMKRNSIKKASTFKLQAARIKYQHYLDQIENCAVAKKFPASLETIKKSSQALFENCYNFREESPFHRGLNYDSRYFGFHSNQSQMIYNQYLGDISEAYLLGDFNGFNKTKHRLLPNEDNGQGWFKLQWDMNYFRLDENSRLQLRTIDSKGNEWIGPPPSCRIVEGDFGIFRKDVLQTQQFAKHRISQLLAYTIDLEQVPLDLCLKFIQDEVELLECFNAVILKNVFKDTKSLIHKFSLNTETVDRLEEIVDKLCSLGLKVILDWNFNPAQMSEPRGVEALYGKQSGACQWQIDLSKDEAMAFVLSNIAYYFKRFGIKGLHFTKVHMLCQSENGILFAKMINLLCERLSEDSVTLASSKEFIPGLSEHIQQGGLGFSFTFNYHQSLTLDQQHESIYQVVKQIHASSNCLALNFNMIQPEDYIYMLFTFLIAKKGMFTQGPLGALRNELMKILKLRKQEQVFCEEAEVTNISEQCVIVKRGLITILFNFSREMIVVEGEFVHNKVLFNDTEEQMKIEGNSLMMGKLNCLVLQREE